MELWRYRRDMYGLWRFMTILIFIVSVVNWIGIARMNYDLPKLYNFLIWFNGTIWVLIVCLIIFFDWKSYNIINYGRLRKGVAHKR